MRNLLAFILVFVGFWWSPAWLMAWLVGRQCGVCDTRARAEKNSAQILHHPGSRGFK